MRAIFCEKSPNPAWNVNSVAVLLDSATGDVETAQPSVAGSLPGASENPSVVIHFLQRKVYDRYVSFRYVPFLIGVIVAVPFHTSGLV